MTLNRYRIAMLALWALSDAVCAQLIYGTGASTPIEQVVANFINRDYEDAVSNATGVLSQLYVADIAAGLCNPDRTDFKAETKEEVISALRPSLDNAGNYNLRQAIGKGLSLESTTDCQEFTEAFIDVMFNCEQQSRRLRADSKQLTVQFFLQRFVSGAVNATVEQDSTLHLRSYPLWAGLDILSPRNISSVITVDQCIAMESRNRYDDDTTEEAMNVLKAVKEIQEKLTACSNGPIDWQRIYQFTDQILSEIAMSVGAQKEHMVKQLLRFTMTDELDWCSPRFRSAKPFFELIHSIITVLDDSNPAPLLVF